MMYGMPYTAEVAYDIMDDALEEAQAKVAHWRRAPSNICARCLFWPRIPSNSVLTHGAFDRLAPNTAG